jgi:ferredoxin
VVAPACLRSKRFVLRSIPPDSNSSTVVFHQEALSPVQTLRNGTANEASTLLLNGEHTMHVEFDRGTCTGIFNCVHEWEKFIEDRDAGKATLVGSDETESKLYVRDVPEDEEFDGEMAARVCPVDAITIYSDEGEQLVP